MQDRLLPENQPSEQAPGNAVINARYKPCEVCGETFDRTEPVLAAYHSTAQHNPLDGA